MSPARAKLTTVRKYALSLLIAQFFDMLTTYIIMSLGGAEANPFMEPMLSNNASFAVMLLVKVSVALLIFHSIKLRITRYEIKEKMVRDVGLVNLTFKEKAYGLTITVLAMVYWMLVGWNCTGIYFLLT
jgi:membrane protein YdbS with pleckstrin-like domain